MTRQQTEQPTKAHQALAKLELGNARFVEGKSIFPRLDAARREQTFADGQFPFASIITCSDSRVPVELIFDQGIGDLFVVRVAGNICAIGGLGSVEYGIGFLGTPLLVVLGHRDCGMVAAALAGDELPGSLPALVEHIKPALSRVQASGESGDELMRTAIRENVWQSIEDLFTRSRTVGERVKAGALKVIGAVYDTEGGAVNWLGEHPEQESLLGKTSKGGSTGL